MQAASPKTTDLILGRPGASVYGQQPSAGILALSPRVCIQALSEQQHHEALRQPTQIQKKIPQPCRSEQPDLIKWASQPTSYNICGYGIACQLTPLTSPDDMLSLPNSKADQQGCGTATATQADEEPGCITIKHHTQAACISHDTTQCNHHLKHFHVGDKTRCVPLAAGPYAELGFLQHTDSGSNRTSLLPPGMPL